MADSSRFGRYEVEEEVARGGMGVIYRVRDPEMRRFLALKVLLPEHGDGSNDGTSGPSKWAARFTDEAQLTGQLDHPGIIPVYDMGRDSEGRLYFTMRLVKGRTLEDIFGLVRDGNEGWSVTRVLGVLQKVCEAMAFAHEHGVLHRDLKPANIMIGRFGETYVMDWGLAKLLDGSEAPRPQETTDSLNTILSSTRAEESNRGGGELDTLQGDVMGTPAYMPPEQARGEVDRLDARADVYAVGAMLYHLLTGHAPYRAAGGEAPSALDVLQGLLEGPPRAVEAEAPGAPPELAAICERAMARERDARYASMLAMADDLQAYVENRVVQAYRRGAVVEFKKWVQRNRGIAASLAALVVLVIAGLGAVSYVQTRARAEVESKNTELATTNRELENARARTEEARALAETNEARAIDNERVARASEQEALWQSYMGNIAAAHAEMEIGSASGARRRLAACSEELRDWEWRYLDQRADGSLRVLTGSETFVMKLAVNPVSTQVAAAGGMVGNSGSPDFAVRIWDFETGELEQVLEGHRTTVSSLVFSPTGDLLATADFQGNFRLWEVASGELIAEARLGAQLDYHPDGRFIVGASSASNGRIVLWDSFDLVEVDSVPAVAGSNAVRFSPDGESIALAGRDFRIRMLDGALNQRLEIDASTETFESDWKVTGDIGPGVYSVDFSPDGSRLVSGTGDGFVRTWNAETGERLLLLDGHRSIVHAVRWHPRFPWLVSSDASANIRFWDADTGRSLDVLRGHDGEVYALGFSELGDRLLSASNDSTVRVWDGQAGANDLKLEGFAYPNFGPYWLSFSPDSERVVWRSGAEEMAVTDVRTGEDRCSVWTLDKFSVIAVHFDGKEIWDGSRFGRIAIWDSETGARLSAVDVAPFLSACEFAPSEEAALIGWPAGFQMVDVRTGEIRWSVNLGGMAEFISVSKDGGRCVVSARTAFGKRVLICLETASGEVVWRQTNQPNLQAMAIFPDGDRFAYTTFNEWDQSVFIGSMETGELLDQFTGHAQPGVLAISPSGTRMVSGNWDGTISLWSPERGELLALPAHARHATRVGFSPDGETIASLGDDGVRRLWNATDVEARQRSRAAAAQRRRWDVDARRRVDELLRSRVHSRAVVEALEADSTLRPKQREAAILLARSASSSPADLALRSFQICADPTRNGAEYMAALEGARLALDLIPEVAELESVPGAPMSEIAPQVALLHCAAALAQIRLGLSREALVSLNRAEEIHALGGSWTSPPIPLLKGLAHHGLGDMEAASSEYAVGRQAMSLSISGWEDILQLARLIETELRGKLGD